MFQALVDLKEKDLFGRCHSQSLIPSSADCLVLLSIPWYVGAGADFVMLGGMFSGHTECAGEVIERNGQKLKLFYGMSSDTAMKKHAGGVAEYRYGCHMVQAASTSLAGYSVL